MKEECAGRPGGMMAQMKSESKTKIGLIDRDIGNSENYIDLRECFLSIVYRAVLEGSEEICS